MRTEEKLYEKSFLLFFQDSSDFIIDSVIERVLRKKMQPILWLRAGLMSVVPVEILKNALDSIDIYIKFDSKKEFKVKISWNQCWPIGDTRPLYALCDLELPGDNKGRGCGAHYTKNNEE